MCVLGRGAERLKSMTQTRTQRIKASPTTWFTFSTLYSTAPAPK